jgi:hypothetical protein
MINYSLSVIKPTELENIEISNLVSKLTENPNILIDIVFIKILLEFHEKHSD